MPSNVLVLGRTGVVLNDVRSATDTTGLTLHAGSTLDDVKTVMANAAIDTVIMGAGIDLDTRLAMLRHIFETSNAATVHMKDRDSAKAGMLPFVDAILTGLRSRPSGPLG
ncbi:MAG: hypothetical protein ACRDQA_22485 [Nocardioidaceae bacterium]